VIKGIKVEGGKRKRHRAVYLDMTNSFSESENESNNVSLILDTPSFNAKIKKKPKFSPSPSSSTDTTSPISFSSGHDTDALHSSSLTSDNKDSSNSCSWDSNIAVACFSCSNLSVGENCSFTNMPKSKSKGKKTASKAKTRAVLWSKSTTRELADNRTFACRTCSHTVKRARNLRYHMCEMHNLWCKTLRQTSSFHQPDSVFRKPTAEEYEVYGHGKLLPAPKKVNKHEPNHVIYEDISEDGDVPTAPNVGVDDITVPYDDPVLSRVRLRLYAAAAGSIDQLSIDAVVVRSLRVEVAPPEIQIDVPSTLNMSTQAGRSHGLSDVMLDRIESYVRR